MNSITSLRDDLHTVFAGLKAGTIEPKVAAEMNNTAGKIIATATVQLKYAELAQIKPNIAFLETGSRAAE
jgi:hypothetical protein